MLRIRFLLQGVTMSESVPGGEHTPHKPRKVSRRRFFAKVGAGGLTAAAVMFGRSGRADASNFGCCDLAIYPPNSSVSQCMHPTGSLHLYSWSCYSQGQACTCCENYYVITSTHYQYQYSAGNCFFV
jgi:hypothetical protein